MATGGWRTVKLALGRAGRHINTTKGGEEGLRALLKELARDLNDLALHTHKCTASGSASASPSGQSTTTSLAFTSYTVES